MARQPPQQPQQQAQGEILDPWDQVVQRLDHIERMLTTLLAQVERVAGPPPPER